MREKEGYWLIVLKDGTFREGRMALKNFRGRMWRLGLRLPKL